MHLVSLKLPRNLIQLVTIKPVLIPDTVYPLNNKGTASYSYKESTFIVTPDSHKNSSNPNEYFD